MGNMWRETRLLQRFLKRKTGWEVLNMGMPGASIYEADDFILSDALDYGPEVAILCYDINSSLYSIMTRDQGGPEPISL